MTIRNLYTNDPIFRQTLNHTFLIQIIVLKMVHL